MTVKAGDRPSGLAGDSASVITFLFRLQPGLVEWRVLVAAARQRRRSRIKTFTYFYGHYKDKDIKGIKRRMSSGNPCAFLLFFAFVT